MASHGILGCMDADVELLLGKLPAEFLYTVERQIDHHIDVVGEAGLAVEDGLRGSDGSMRQAPRRFLLHLVGLPLGMLSSQMVDQHPACTGEHLAGDRQALGPRLLAQHGHHRVVEQLDPDVAHGHQVVVITHTNGHPPNLLALPEG